MSIMSVRRAALVAAATLLLTAAPAAAHVTVSSPDAAQGGYGKLVFRVPTESDTASTTKLQITLPDNAPLGSLSAQPKPGWKVEVTKGKLPEPVEVHGTEMTEAVRTVTWTATGDGIAPGEFDEFALSGGAFPETESMTFTATQTYDDGDVVAWDQVVEEGEDEPEKPAPSLALLPASADGHGGQHSADNASETTTETGSGDTLSRVLSGLALLVAVGALLGVVRQDRRRAS